MKQYFGNYLGMVINSSDPEYRGRVQVFVPHIMPAIYEGWNKEGVDIQITCVGSNIPEGLTPDIHAKLVKILPWAEAASPIIGSSAPGNLFSDIVAGVKNAAGAVAEGASSFFSQDPSANPITPSGSTGTDIANAATANLNFSTANLPGTDGGNLGCAAAVSKIFKDGTGQDIIPGKKVVLSTSELYSHMSTSKDWVRVPKEQIQPGDILVTASGAKAGHTGVYTGVGPNTITSNSSSGFMGSARGTVQANYNLSSWEKVEARNPSQSGVFRYVGPGAAAPSGAAPSSGTSSSTGSEKTATSNEPATPNPHATPNPSSELLSTPKVPEQGAIQPTPGAGTIEGTVSGGGTVTTGNAKLGSDRQARFGAELSSNQEQVLARLQVLASREVGNSPAAIQAFTESVVNRAYFSNRSLDKVLYESSYGFTDRTTAAPSPAVREAFNKVMSGGNMTNLATDAGFNLPNSGRGKNGLFITGMQSKDYVIQGVLDLKTGKQVTDQALLNKLYTEGDRTGNYEFFVRQSRGTSAAGIEAYAQQNGITSDGFATDLNANLSAAGGAVTTSNASSGSMNVVNNTDSYGRTPIMNTNDMANGLFAYPNPGAMVWVFFREGNPLYPVYFAASYSSKEWSSAYRGGSQATGYYNDGKKISRATNIKPDPSGGLYTKFESSLEDTTGIQEKASLMLYHKGGSNLSFENGIDFYHSHYARRDEVEQDRFVVTKGYKDEWVEGDYSTNVRGDLKIRVGKFDEETMKALQELAKISAETNAQLTGSGGGSSGGSSQQTTNSNSASSGEDPRVTRLKELEAQKKDLEAARQRNAADERAQNAAR